MDALVSTTEEEEAVRFLLDAESSRRLLVLRAILDAGAGVAGVAEAWELLEAAERVGPDSFRRVLLDPQVGLWAASLLRRLSRRDPSATADEAPLHVELGFLRQVAVAVFIACGADFRARVPVREGLVFLPGVGRATVGGDPWGTAEVRGDDGRVRVVAGDVSVTLPEKRDQDAPGWEGQRWLHARHAGMSLTLALDDLGPYAPVPTLTTSGRLSRAQFASWQHWFERMWRVLVDRHRSRARALTAGLRSVVPLPRGERLRARAASSSDAFGCLLLSEPDEDAEFLPAQLGVAVLHEFRHTLLNGLLFLAPLFDETDELFYAPWRDDPRPLGGLVHGAYAFSGVARYWRSCGPEGLAGFEFAIWRNAVRVVLESLRNHSAMTPLGHTMIDGLAEQTEGWCAEPVGPREERLARLAAVHHHATWRAHHLQVSPAEATRLAESWRAGRRADIGARIEPVLRVDVRARRLDSFAMLARLSLTVPVEFDALRVEEDPATKVPGVMPADLALVDGDAGTAVKLYSEELAGPNSRPAAWAGLGLALTECGEREAGTAVTTHPEVALAVARSLPAPPDPVLLAHWLAK
ncbi:HEXXH motif domain-containing protein [Streptomyces sp. NPDC004528]|uniref:HEXXH motif domain-containing protein n=1 Tax=Streptomyces sp. NPDC004528 TaxID=3154550 RepID=UPI0033B318C4